MFCDLQCHFENAKTNRSVLPRSLNFIVISPMVPSPWPLNVGYSYHVHFIHSKIVLCFSNLQCYFENTKTDMGALQLNPIGNSPMVQCPWPNLLVPRSFIMYEVRNFVIYNSYFENTRTN